MKKLKASFKFGNTVINTKILAFFFPVTLALLLVCLLITAQNIHFFCPAQKLQDSPLADFVPVSYPEPAVLGASTISPDFSAEAALVVDDTSKVVLYSKNPTLHFSMASTTKIMTALVALEHYKPEDLLTVKGTKVEEVTVGFTKGEQVRFSDMLYALLLPSGNDAAVILAENYPGGKDAFIEIMNQKAQELHLYNTHFADPAGLEDNDYTTALDLARLCSYAMENSTFAETVGTKLKVITTVTGKTYVLKSTNQLLGINGINGIKTGFTQEAGGVLTT
jgi:D-alanyl-D-alanine carboxypeptidase (penicillin-binding protein 5/6)